MESGDNPHNFIGPNTVAICFKTDTLVETSKNIFKYIRKMTTIHPSMVVLLVTVYIYFFLCINIVYSLTASATHGRSICDCAASGIRVDWEKFSDVLCQWLVALEADTLIYE